jgi:ATP-dependent exoDNAse (exonuclease V) alpha subunit
VDADLVVIDVTSMVDVILANKLVKAVAPAAHLLLVGDVDQLPSVGAGEVLRDLIGAATLPGGHADEEIGYDFDELDELAQACGAGTVS